MGWKVKGSTFVEFCVAWLLLLGIIGAVAGGAQSSPATTTVTDTVYRADGTAAGGTVLVAWPAFSTAGGASIPAGTTSITIGSGGAFSVNLVPNAGSTPMGSYYTVVYHLDDGTVTREYWVVPASPSTVTVATIRSSVLPASVAMQTVSKAYVDSAIAAAVTGTPLDASPYVQKTGDTMTGPLVLPADPTSAQQAADKHYVDTQVAGVTAGLGQKVSLNPTTTQVVTQPVGTTLAVTNLNGVEDASLFVSGGGNNGIANAMATSDCAGGCTVNVEPTYASNEGPVPTNWPVLTHLQDLRFGGRFDTYRDPMNLVDGGFNAAQSIDLVSTRSAAATQAIVAGGGLTAIGLQVKQSALTGGNNTYPAHVQGTVPYFKSNYSAAQFGGINNTPGQHILLGENQTCYGVGDCLLGAQFITSSGGFRDDFDEGTHPYDIQIAEDTAVLEGTCQTGCTTGSTLVKLAITANPGTEGEGRYLIDLNPAGIIATGTIASGGTAFSGRQPAVTFQGTSFPVSTFLETAATVTSQANVMQPGTVTVPIVTSGVPAGFQTSTAALPTSSGVACVTDVAAVDGRALNYEMAAYTVIDASHVSLTLNRPHGNGATLAFGGLCGYGLEQTEDTTLGIRQVFPVVGSTSATSLLYAAGATAVIGVTHGTGAYLNLSASIASISRTGNVVSVTTAGNLAANVNGLTLAVTGVADASYNGSFVVTTTGSNSLTYAQTGANSSSAGGTVAFLNGGFALYPMAEVIGVYDAAAKAIDGQMTLAANTVAWAVNDPVEEPHYFQQRVAADTQFITQYSARVPGTTQAAGIQYQGNNGPGLQGWVINNTTSPGTYLGGGGTRSAPDFAFQAAGVWNETMDLGAGVTAAIAVHCNLHGCGRWDSAYSLFQLDSAVGQDTIQYAPASSGLTFHLNGTQYGFTPQGFTAGTITVGTLNATTVNGGAIQAVAFSGNAKDVSGIGGIPQRANLLAEYLLNEGSGTIAHDTSGLGNNGTISGATWESTADLTFTTLGQYIQMPVAVNQANTFQFAIYAPPFGNGVAPQPPGYGGAGGFGANASLLCGTDSVHSCLVSASLLSGPHSERFYALNSSHTEALEALTAGWHIVTLVNGQSGQLDHIYFDGAEVNGYVAQGSGMLSHPTTGNYQIGGSSAYFGTWWLGKVAAAWAWSSSLSGTDVQAAATAATAFVRGKGGFVNYRPAPHDAGLIIGGLDSRTQGTNGVSSAANVWLANLSLTDSTYTTLNLGFAGSLAYDDAANFDMVYGPAIGTGSGPSILILWGGVNDYPHGFSSRQIANSLKKMTQKAKALGARVIVATETSSYGGGDAYKDGLNPILRAEAFTWGADNIADLATISQLGADGAYANTTYFADGVHPNNTGELYLDTVFSNAVNELIGSNETTNRHQTAAASYQELAGDRFLDLTGTSAQTLTLPSCVGYSLPRQVVNVGTAAATVGPVSGQTLTGSTTIAVGARATFSPIPGSLAASGCTWERTQ
jgi:lysophospholipase L1-like esterase